MPVTNIIIYLALLAGAVLSYTTRKLTLAGSITGGITGVLIYNGCGLTGICMLAVFFLAGSWATSLKGPQKSKIYATEQNNGRRNSGQVLANGGVAALLGAIAWYFPDKTGIVVMMMAGSFAAAIADTLSSELGMVYGRRFINILSFKPDQCGLDGVVSIEGTLAGLAGAVLIAFIYAATCGWGISFWWIVLAGFVGNLTDSVAGAALERKGWIGNDGVNFLNTTIGALVCWLAFQ